MSARDDDVRAPAWVRRIAGVDAGTRLTLDTLWSFAPWTAEGVGLVWPTVAALAARCGDPVRTVQHRLAKLVSLGWIRRTRHQGHDAFELAWCNPWRDQCNPLRWETQPVARATHCAEDRNPLRGGVQPVAVEGCNPLHPEQTENKQEQPGPEREARAPEREALRASTAPDPIVRLVSDHEASFTQAMSSPWLASMAEAVADLGLDAEQVRALLDAWQAERDRLKAGARGALLAAHRDGSLPEMREIWWARRRPWLLATLTGSSPPTRGDVQLKPRKRGRFQDTTDYTPEART